MSKKAETKKDAKEITAQEYLNQRVPYYSIKDGGKYKDDIVVIVNGKIFQIQRGKTVKIPRYVRNVIMDAERQKNKANDYSDSLVNSYKAKSGIMG